MLGTCIVFGGSGWTGSFLVSQLVKLSYLECNADMKVYSVDITPPSESLQKLHEGETSFEYCDITDKVAVQSLLNRINPKTIFHVAAIVDLRQYPSPLIEKVNVDGTLNIIHWSRNTNCGAGNENNSDDVKLKYLVYTSSIDVVSSRLGAMGADETTPYVNRPSNHYKRTKIIAEKAVLEMNNQHGWRTCSLRPGHIFGPADMLLPWTVLPIAIGPRTARMSFSYVENCARAHILAAEKLIKESSFMVSSNSFSTTKQSDNNNKSGQEVVINRKDGGNDNNNILSGKVIFICDFDTNFADTYRMLGGHGPIKIRIPTLVVKMIVYIAEMMESLFYKCFGIQIITHPITGISNAMLEACGNHTAHSHLAAKLIGYTPFINHQSSQTQTYLQHSYQHPEQPPNNAPPAIEGHVISASDGLVSPSEAIRRTVYFSQTGRLPLECLK